jgi:DNA topoisomerase-2
MASSDLTKYKKYNLREHVYELPDTYVGSIEPTHLETYILQDGRFAMKSVHICPALFKLFDEALVNAIDHSSRALTIPVTKIMVTIDQQSGRIRVWNNGDGIDIDKHPEHNVYIPELIFGHLLTSTNYEKDEERTVGGKNGMGVKLVNIFSKELILETVDAGRKKLYQQRFHDNLKQADAPIITRCTKKPYTSVEFLPDYQRFGVSGLTDDMYDLFRKRVYDACACTNNKVDIYLNEQKIDCKNFEKYVDLYIGSSRNGGQPRVYEQVNERWEVALTYSDEGFKQVSFVNGINTLRGGTHVNYVVNQITKKLVDLIKSKKKKAVKASHIREYMSVFVKATIVNPSFDSQTKETLTTQVAKFGSKCELSDKFMEKVYKSGIIERAIKFSDFQETKNLSKLDGKKKSRLYVPKLDDANKAGTKESQKCTLILTEGDSAKTMAISGLTEIGRDYYGVFPLKGKLLNVKDAAIKKITENEEIANIIKIIGLEIGKDYDSLESLRYGRVLLLCDQDEDGFHITGLVMNFFASMWPSLAKMGTFIVRMVTPIVKANKGNQMISFYNLRDYEEWKKTDPKGYAIKYYKGLGTSTSKEAKEYFRNINLLQFFWSDRSDQALDLAFNKKRANDRKQWLMAYNRDITLDYKNPRFSYEEFVHKELIHYSNSDLERSIPSIMDGLKESTRKIFFGCIKKKLFSKIKVAQLAGYISEQACYHHGEASLQLAIIGMAQNYMGSNNINLLMPDGQFGTRIQGGKDAAAPRYIFTMLNPIVKTIFNENDLPLLKYLDDEGFSIQPEFYCPILPTVLMNGVTGIGTGFSTTLPCYNPRDIVQVLYHIIEALQNSEGLFYMKGIIDQLDHLQEPEPWYLGFKGQIMRVGSAFISRGVYEVIDNSTVKITELPIGVWTQDYKEMLDKMVLDNRYLKDYSSQCDDLNVCFILKFQPNVLKDLLNTESKKGENKFEAEFKLSYSRGLSTSNIHLYNAEGRIQKYDSIIEIIKEFAKIRIEFYFKRKDYLMKKMEEDLLILSTRNRFITDVITNKILIMNQKAQRIRDQLHGLGYPEELVDSLIKMPISQFTYERKQELEQAKQNCEHQLLKLKETSIQEMWSRELENFISEYDQYETARLKELHQL